MVEQAPAAPPARLVSQTRFGELGIGRNENEGGRGRMILSPVSHPVERGCSCSLGWEVTVGSGSFGVFFGGGYERSTRHS